MAVSECCGAETKAEYRSEHPITFDDTYDLKIPVLVCTKCGKIVGQNSYKSRENEENGT